jgi:AhpC/TSA family protein
VLGLGVAAISYDEPGVLKAFATRKGVTIPMLADPGSRIIRQFRMVDPDNTENNVPAYGAKDTAYPGYFAINPAGVVTERFVDGGYDDRRTANALIATLFPELVESRGATVNATHVSITLGQTDTVVNLGSRLELFVDLSIPAGIHVYAPGVKEYRPLEVVLSGSEWVRTIEPVYAPSRMVELQAVHETVPAYEHKTRIVIDVVIANTFALIRTLAKNPAVPQPVTLNATLRYQACSQTTCYKPADVPLAWTLQVKLPDRDRAKQGDH